VSNKKQNYLSVTGGYLMITKTEFWKQVQSQLKDVGRSHKIITQIMKKIKDIPQSENKKEKDC